MNLTRTRIATTAALLALAATASACSTIAEPDEIVLYYSGGSVEGSKFEECINPAAKGPGTVNDHVFRLPTSLRTWNIRPQGGDTDKPVTAGTKPDAKGQAGPQVVVYTTVEFYLNTNCGNGKDANSPIVQFWEKTGRRYKVANPDSGEFDEGAWKNMLLNTLVPVLEKTTQGVTRDYTADELDADLNGTWKKAEDAMATEFAEQLRAKVGGDYFCGPAYNRANPACPPVRVSITDINYADGNLQQARANVRKAEEDAKRRLIEAQAQVDEAAILQKASRDPNYMELKRLENQLAAAQACASNPNCTLVIGASGVNVTTK